MLGYAFGTTGPGVLRRGLASLIVLMPIVGVVSAAGATPGAARCLATASGGDWAAYGQDLHGSQYQRSEHVISPANVANLKQVWTSGALGLEYGSAPPIVSGGCVFINTGGHVEARALATGALVWRSQGADTTGTYAVTVVNGRVHVGLNNNGHPEAAAFDVRNGRLLWKSSEIYFGYTTTQQSSAVVYDGVQVLFTTGPDNDPQAKEGYGLIDAATGRVLYKSTTIPTEQLKNGYAGGGVWGTATVDADSGYLYVGTSNPESKTKESAYDDSIIKMDVDRSRPTFGQIVATLKGDPDSVTGYDNPVCQTVGDQAWVNGGVYGASPSCGQTDIDIGVGPTLWRDAGGRLMGAVTQKSGTLHVFQADTMTRAWDKQLFASLGPVGGNICRIATDGKVLYVAANPGVLWALDATSGSVLWQAPLTPVPEPMMGGNVALANGVVYYVDSPAARAWDAKTGR